MKKRYNIYFCSIVILLVMLGVMTPNHVKAKNKIQKAVYNGTEYYYEYKGSGKKKIEITKIKNMSTTLIIPAKLDGKEVYGTCGVDSYDMMKTDSSYKKVKNIVIEEGVKGIGYFCFSKFPISNISIPKSVSRICSYAFEDCNKLKTIKFSNPKIVIEEDAFAGCRNLNKIEWEMKIFRGKIGQSAFNCCDLQNLNLPYMPNMKKQIKRFAFAHNDQLKKITFSSKNTNIEIGRDWFSDCKKSKIIVGKNVKTFSSAVNANVGTVRLLGKNTKLKGFKKVEKLQNMSTEEFEKLDKEGKTRYYIQYKKFIVPKKSKALKVLNRAYYGKVNDVGEERYDSDSNEYYNSTLKKVKVIIK